MQFTVLIENTKEDPNLFQEHGLSILVKHNNNHYLIDVGYSDNFLKNATYLNEDLSKVNDIIITHGHIDHGGGLEYLTNTNKKIHLKESALGHYYSKREEGQIDIGLFHFKDKPLDFNFVEDKTTICDGVHILSVGIPKKPQPISNGLLLDSSEVADSFDHELFVVLVEDEGLYIMTGCAHKGFLNILDKAKEEFPDKKIKALIGGLHLVNKAESDEVYKNYLEEIDHYFRNDKSIEVFTGHCTGQPAIDFLKSKGYNITKLYTGMKHSF